MEAPPTPAPTADTAAEAGTDTEPAAPEGGRGRRAFWVVLATVVILDLASKYLIFAFDPAYGQRPPRPELAQPWSDHAATIFCQLNKGAAWSLGSGRPWLIFLITVILIPVLFAVYWRGFRPRGRPIEHLCFGAILGGALGNAWDRTLAFFRWDPVITGVRDFIHVDLGFWPCAPFPTFNVADSALTGAVAILLVIGLFQGGGASHAASHNP